MIRPLEIDYRRPPDHRQVYRQELLVDRADVMISFVPAIALEQPMRIGGEVALEPGSPVVWFTFPDRWHDIGRFHTADGRFTGLYANILTPVTVDDPGTGVARWETTDLFLDLWRGAGGPPVILDEDEWEAARAAGHLDEATATRAWREARALLAAAREGHWPPPVVEEWTLERALDYRALTRRR